MGIRSNSESDPTLAKPHETGASVALIQVTEHKQFGAIFHMVPSHGSVPSLWELHLRVCRQAHERHRATQDAVLAVPVGADGTRLVSDPDLIFAVYESGSAYVVNAVLAVQHLCLHMEQLAEAEAHGHEGPVDERLKAVAAAWGLEALLLAEGKDAWTEIQQNRNAIEHPKAENWYRHGLDGSWDRVPLAWLLSDRAGKTFESFDAWFVRIVDAWHEKLAAKPKNEQTWTVERGMKSNHQFKKPPKN